MSEYSLHTVSVQEPSRVYYTWDIKQRKMTFGINLENYEGQYKYIVFGMKTFQLVWILFTIFGIIVPSLMKAIFYGEPYRIIHTYRMKRKIPSKQNLFTHNIFTSEESTRSFFFSPFLT